MNKAVKIVVSFLLFLVNIYAFSVTSPNRNSELVDELIIEAKTFFGRDYLSAKKLVDSAIVLAENTNYNEGMADGFITLSEIYNSLGVKDSFHMYLKFSEKLITEKGLDFKMSRVNYLKGLYYQDEGIYDSASIAYYEGLKIAEEFNDTAIIGNLSNNLGLLYVKLKQYRKAIDIFKKVIVEKSNKSHTTAGTVYFNMAYTYQLMEEMDSALMHYELAEDIYLEDNHLSGIAGIHNNLSHYYKNQGNLEKALNYQLKALDYDIIVGTPYYQTIDYFNLGSLYNRLDSLDKAIENYSYGIELAREKGYLRLKANMLRNVSYLYRKKGDFPTAFKLMAESVTLKDSLFNTDLEKRINEAELRHKNEQEMRKNEYLVQASNIDRKVILFQRWFVAVLVVSILLLFGLLVFNFRKQKQINNLNQRLEQYNDDLKEINGNKDKYLAIISHDLRGPLGSMRELLSLFIEEDRAPDKEHLKVLLSEVENTNALLEDLLHWSQIQFNRQSIVKEYVKLNDIANDVVRSLLFLSNKKRLTIQLEIDENLKAYCDKNMLKIVLRNLVSNAIKFSNSDGSIHIKGENTEKGMVLISVSDDGVGISEKRLSNIFDPAKAISTTGTRNEKGTGLGLVLCKEFVEMNIGEIHIQSIEGKGTNVNILLPEGSSS